jgi:hypothetical protein
MLKNISAKVNQIAIQTHYVTFANPASRPFNRDIIEKGKYLLSFKN